MGRDRTILPHPARPLSRRGRFLRTAGAGVLIAALACSGDVPFASPGTGVAVTVRTYHCSGGCGTATGPVDTVRRGDTALVRVSIADTAGDSTVALLRASCATNVTILGGSAIHTLPAAPTCPDSGVAAEIGAVPYLRDVVWVVDASFAPGDYTLLGDVVIDPPVISRTPVHVE